MVGATQVWCTNKDDLSLFCFPARGCRCWLGFAGDRPRHPVSGPGADLVGQAGSGHEASAECGLLQGRPGPAFRPAALAAGSGSQGIVLRHPVCEPGSFRVGQAGSGHEASAACGLLQGRHGSASLLAAIRCWLGFAGDCL